MNYRFDYLKQIEKKFGCPFYLMYPEVFNNNIKNFRNAFLKHYNKILVGYSFKTSYIPAIVGLAKGTGCFAEVVSGMEYEMAQRLGYNPKEIIFNGPVKRKDELYYAIKNGSVVNLDSWYEVENVIAYKKQNKDKNVKVGLRINMNLTKEDGKSAIQLGLRTGRFGLSDDILEKAVPLLRKHNVIINSLHGHTSSSDRATNNYIAITKKLLQVAEKYEFKFIEHFNIGGGFFGAPAKGIDTTGKPTYQDYADTVMNIVLNNDWFNKHKPIFVIEPGVSVVANVFSFVTKVFQHKIIDNNNFIVVDGSVFDVKPSMHTFNLPHYLIKKNDEERQTIVTDVVGSTCMEKDVILKDMKLEKALPDEYICIDGVGAYTHNFTPDFINYVAPIIALENNKQKLVRRRQNMDDVLRQYLYK